MKKIGFIDNFLSEWHANNYPVMFPKNPRYKELGAEIAYAYAREDVSPYDNVTTDEWCKKFNVQKCRTVQEVVDKSDYLIVLSPDNPELHEELCELPMKSGKPVYVDKTFAPGKAAAERIFNLAAKNNTPVWSSSALRFADEIKKYRESADGAVSCIAAGPGDFGSYAIHTFEMIMSVMKPGVKKVTGLTDTFNRSIIAEWNDGRRALFTQMQAHNAPFQITVETKNENAGYFYNIADAYFPRFIDALMEFFATGKPPVTTQETIELMGMLDAGQKALKEPFKWIEI